MSAREIRLERSLAASPERVYRMWADPDSLSSWLPRSVAGSLAPGTRSELVWHARRTWWDIAQAEPERRFRFRCPWLDGDRVVTDVRVELSPRGYGTRLVLIDGPFDTADADGLEAWAEALETWSTALAQLRAQVDFSVDLRDRER